MTDDLFPELKYYSWEARHDSFKDFYLNKKHSETLTETIRFFYTTERTPEGLLFECQWLKEDNSGGNIRDDEEKKLMVVESGRELAYLIPYPEEVVRFPLSGTFNNIYDYPVEFEDGHYYMLMFKSEAIEELEKQKQMLNDFDLFLEITK